VASRCRVLMTCSFEIRDFLPCMASPSQDSNSQKLENPVAVDKSARVSPADVGLPFWPALEGSQVDRSVAPAAYFIARTNHESKDFLRPSMAHVAQPGAVLGGRTALQGREKM